MIRRWMGRGVEERRKLLLKCYEWPMAEYIDDVVPGSDDDDVPGDDGC
jgi:hypothetical protein